VTAERGPASPDHLECVVLAHGGGGELTGRLIEEHFLPHLNNDRLGRLTDGAVLAWPRGDLVFTTDSYVVTPLEFPGGDIGSMSVSGTINDLSVMGATPIALSLGLILEEGLPLVVLDRVVASLAATARAAGVEIVTGDTKVIERRTGDGLFINTAGVGRVRRGLKLDLARVQSGDAILINGTVADHGLTIMSVRSDIRFDSELRSDAAPLNGLIGVLLDSGAEVKFLRDATRGGVAGVLADICEGSGLSVEIEEKDIPILPTARHAAELLGLDPITVANEGKCICVVAGPDATKAVEALRSHPLGRRAAVIGRVTDSEPPLVELHTRVGGYRVVQRPYGEELPRIC
jgi:hydrogenase expression/formation protein HypE